MTEGDVRNQLDTDERETLELKVRRYEEIYRFAQKAYDDETTSSDLLEKRIFNFLTVSLVLLGLSFTLLSRATQPMPWLLACLGATMIAVIFFLWAIRAGKVMLPPVGRPPIDYLREKTTYLQALHKLSEKYMEAAEFNSEKSERMSCTSRVGYWFLFVAITLFVFATFYHVAVVSTQDSQTHISSQRSQ